MLDKKRIGRDGGGEEGAGEKARIGNLDLRVLESEDESGLVDQLEGQVEEQVESDQFRRQFRRAGQCQAEQAEARQHLQ